MKALALFFLILVPGLNLAQAENTSEKPRKPASALSYAIENPSDDFKTDSNGMNNYGDSLVRVADKANGIVCYYTYHISGGNSTASVPTCIKNR